MDVCEFPVKLTLLYGAIIKVEFAEKFPKVKRNAPQQPPKRDGAISFRVRAARCTAYANNSPSENSD
jgi:hypothetical protein